MSHTSEILRRLQKVGPILVDEQTFSKVQLAANTAINAQRSDWYQTFERELADASGRSVAEVTAAIAKFAGLTDAMKYVQLGNPEDVIITEGSAPSAGEHWR